MNGFRVNAVFATILLLIACVSLTDTCIGDDKDDAASELRGRGAKVTELSYLDRRAYIVNFAHSEESRKCSDDDMHAVARLGRVISLGLRGCRNVTDDGIQALDKLEYLGALDAIGPSIQGPGLEALRDKGLKSLTLMATKIDDDSVAVLTKLNDLERLHLSAPISDRGAVELAKIESLELLDLTDCVVTDKGLEALASLPKLRSIIFDSSAAVLVHRELENRPVGISEWWDASCGQCGGIVPPRFYALAPIPE